MDGTDAIMLSAETSIGKYPVESVINMAKISSEAELNCLAKKTVVKAPRKACGGLAPYAELTCVKF